MPRSSTVRAAWVSGKRDWPRAVSRQNWEGRPTPRDWLQLSTSPSSASRTNCWRAASPEVPKARPSSAAVFSPCILRWNRMRSPALRGLQLCATWASASMTGLLLDMAPERHLESTYLENTEDGAQDQVLPLPSLPFLARERR